MQTQQKQSSVRNLRGGVGRTVIQIRDSVVLLVDSKFLVDLDAESEARLISRLRRLGGLDRKPIKRGTAHRSNSRR